MANINAKQLRETSINLQVEKDLASRMLYTSARERVKTETKLFGNLAMCEAQLESFSNDFKNNCLSGHAMMEWSDRIEKLNRARKIILELIESKTKEWMLEKKT